MGCSSFQKSTHELLDPCRLSFFCLCLHSGIVQYFAKLILSCRRKPATQLFENLIYVIDDDSKLWPDQSFDKIEAVLLLRLIVNRHLQLYTQRHDGIHAGNFMLLRLTSAVVVSVNYLSARQSVHFAFRVFQSSKQN